jgi:hypothetical protein
MPADRELLRKALFGGSSVSDRDVVQLFAALDAEESGKPVGSPLSPWVAAQLAEWKKSAPRRVQSNAAMQNWSQAAKAGKEELERLACVPIPVADLKKYIENLYANAPSLESSGPESMLRSVLESYLADPGALRRPHTSDPADIWPLLIDIALRKLADRQARAGETAKRAESLLLSAGDLANFVTLLRDLCGKLWSRLKSDDERSIARLCLQRKSLADIGAASKKSSEVIDLLLKQLRTHVAQLSLSGA